MINVAADYYPNGQEFNFPWKFWVIDDFLNPSFYQQLLEIKEAEDYELVDRSDGKDATAKNSIASKYHIRIRQKNKYSKLYSLIDKNCIDNLSKCFNFKEYINWSSNTHFIYDLVRCDPLYAYQKHVDHIDKKISIVVYLHPEQGDGTVLLDKDNNSYNVVWKPNRAFIFVTSSEAFHYYINTTNQHRFSLNIYAVDGNWEFDVSAR